jgi:hypothetical protein
LDTRSDSELRQDMREMRPDRVLADDELIRDLIV